MKLERFSRVDHQPIVLGRMETPKNNQGKAKKSLQRIKAKRILAPP